MQDNISGASGDLTADSIVSSKHSDHELVQLVAKSAEIGPTHIFLLNLLTQHAITFRQDPDSQEPAKKWVNVRLNLPLSWYESHPSKARVLGELKQQGLSLRQYNKSKGAIVWKNLLELHHLDSGKPATAPPLQLKYFLESEADYHARLYRLGCLMGSLMEQSVAQGEIAIGAVQELQIDASEDNRHIHAFMSGVNADNRGHLVCYYLPPKPGETCTPGILYSSKQLIRYEDTYTRARIKAFKQAFSAILTTDPNCEPDAAGLICVASFIHLPSEHLVFVVSYHGEFRHGSNKKHDTPTLLAQLADLAQSHRFIIAGDTNHTIRNPIKIPEHKSAPFACDVLSKVTEPGLQIHDTMDAIWVPPHHERHPKHRKAAQPLPFSQLLSSSSAFLNGKPTNHSDPALLQQTGAPVCLGKADF